METTSKMNIVVDLYDADAVEIVGRALLDLALRKRGASPTKPSCACDKTEKKEVKVVVTPMRVTTPKPVTNMSTGNTPVQTVPSVTPVPAAPAETPAVNAAQPPQVDKNGVPWDGRIHSTPAKLTTKNEWKKKRNVTAELTAQVTAELMGAQQGQPSATPVASAQPATTGAVPPPPQNMQTIPTPNAAAQVIDATTITDLPSFMRYVDERGIDDNTANAACIQNNIPSIGALGTPNFAAQIPMVVAYLEAQQNG